MHNIPAYSTRLFINFPSLQSYFFYNNYFRVSFQDCSKGDNESSKAEEKNGSTQDPAPKSEEEKMET